MASIGYYFKVLKGASFDKLNQAADAVHARSGKSKLGIKLDMAWCALRYGAGYYDYQIFAFETLNAAQRKTFVTRFISKKLNLFMNDTAYMPMVDNKDLFYQNYREFIGRDFLVLPDSTIEDVEKFVEGKDRIFCKMRALECGIGCERLNVADFENIEALWAYLQEKGFYTIEDVIVCHPDVRKLYDNAVNSMRIITMLDKDQNAHCLYVVQKIGLNGSIIDNNCMFSRVDIETGRIMYPAHSGDTTKGIIYEEHPNTHVKIQGYQLPFVKEAVEMCLKAAKVIPQVRYMGWDVAVTENGPVIIEGNTYCAHDFWQLPPHTPDKIGMLPKIKEIVPEFKY
ncbi:MAG: carboxylate--amine ligase [Clostridia bacterium]|nr:carboxylate--amine ligase [Clostridia bacterium]